MNNLCKCELGDLGWVCNDNDVSALKHRTWMLPRCRWTWDSCPLNYTCKFYIYTCNFSKKVWEALKNSHIYSKIDGWRKQTLAKQKLFPGYGCVRLGTVIHEMLHASGFWHEQSRPDRDEHVEIFWSNIQAGMEDNFARYSRAEVSTLSLPYDTDSVMHYSSTAFSRNGQYTIKPKK